MRTLRTRGSRAYYTVRQAGILYDETVQSAVVEGNHSRELFKNDLAVDEPGVGEILGGELLQRGIVECRLEAFGEYSELRGAQLSAA